MRLYLVSASILMLPWLTVLPAMTEDRASIPKSVNRIAASATILIQTPGSPGSAVVIKNSSESCTAITAFHVVESVNEHEYGELIFPGRASSLELRPDMISRVNNTDFAILRMPESCPVSQVAILGNPNDVQIGDKLYVAGYSANVSPEVDRPSYRLVSGVLLSLTEQPDGYSLTYDALTSSGMSGGPIFASNATLVGIHGRGETLANTGQKIAAMGMSVRLARLFPSGSMIESSPLRFIMPLRSAPCPGVVC